jgi:alpha-tubulin suppressor-like RCC1 family protein
MLNIKTINTASFFPLKLSSTLNLYGNFTQTTDGYSFYSYDVLSDINDISLQNNSGLLLTKQKNLQSLYKSSKQSIESFQLNDFAYLKFKKSRKFVTFSDAPKITVSNIYTSNDFIYFIFNKNGTVSLKYKNFYFTVSRQYPYNIYLDKKRDNDDFNEQQFKFTQESNRLVLLVFVIDSRTNSEIQRYISYSPVTNELHAVGLELSQVTVNEYELEIVRDNLEQFTPDLIPQSYAVEYYNSFDSVNNVTTEIANKIPLNKINFLFHVPYKKQTELVELTDNKQYFDLPVDIVSLKNILTPAHTISKVFIPPLILDFNPKTIFFEPNITSDYNFDTRILDIKAYNIPPQPTKIGKTLIDILPDTYNLSLQYYGGLNAREELPALTEGRIIGVACNGVYLQNYTSKEKPFSNTIFKYNIVSNQLSGIDYAGGFPDSNNRYKYYTGQFLLNNTLQDILDLNEYYKGTDRHYDGHSKIFGYSMDGYPIYGPYGYSNPLDPESSVKNMESSYGLSAIPNRPPVSAYPLGVFAQDYIHIPQSGDLDEHNGRFCVTPEYPKGTYAYFFTIDMKSFKPVFPYIIGRTFYGKSIYESPSAIDPETGETVTEPPRPIKSITIKYPTNNIYTTGRNNSGQLLNSSNKLIKSSFQETLTGVWDKISLGQTHALLLSSTNLYVGGSNEFGQIGNTDSSVRNEVPRLVPGEWTDIFATYNTSFALDKNKNLYGTGDNRFGQLGLVNQTVTRTNIRNWSLLSEVDETNVVFKKIVGGLNHTLALKSNNRMFITGSNLEGQLGMGDSPEFNQILQWQILPGGRQWRDIACGARHSLAIATDGNIYACGENIYGETGVPGLFGVKITEWTLSLPRPGEPSSQWKKIACGYFCSYALTEDGRLFAVGDNQFGQLGLEDRNIRPTWTQIPGVWDDISAGRNHAAALSGGNIFIIGDNQFGQLGLGFRGPIGDQLGGNVFTLVPQSTGNIVASSNDPRDWATTTYSLAVNPSAVRAPDNTFRAHLYQITRNWWSYLYTNLINSRPRSVTPWLLPNTTYTMSIHIKYLENNITRMVWETPPSHRSTLSRAGTFDIILGTSIDGDTSYVENLTGGWMRIVTTFRSTSLPTYRALYFNNFGRSNLTDGSVAIYGAQIEEGIKATKYQPTTRITSTGACSGSFVPEPIKWKEIICGGDFTYATALDTFTYTFTAFDDTAETA